MSLRVRLLILLLVVYGAGGYYLTRRALEEVRPRYLESMEESLVDTSVLLASLVENQLVDGRLDSAMLEQAFTRVRQRGIKAQIYTLEKTTMDVRVYITDAHGLVVYDSAGLDVGADYSRWNDVKRTLEGRYGARSSRGDPGDDSTQVIYVAAPIVDHGRLVGVLSVGKPTDGINQLVVVARRKLLMWALAGGLAILAGLLLVAAWVISPLERLTAYAQAIRDGRAAPLPSLPGHTLQVLGRSFEEMRDALEGRQHVERYTQSLAHEVKAPLAAIRGAAELMDEAMPADQRARFLGNIRNESARIQRIIDRLLELSSLEARKALRQTEAIAVEKLLAESVDVMRPAAEPRGIRIVVPAQESGLVVRGEFVLLREALVNLLQNAVEFSSAGAEVAVTIESVPGRVTFVVTDSGSGIPDFAMPRVFERFYSLPRPGTERKSTGLGLALVREIAHLHGGEVSLENRPKGGAEARLMLPV